jgi:hypothetical protein
MPLAKAQTLRARRIINTILVYLQEREQAEPVAAAIGGEPAGAYLAEVVELIVRRSSSPAPHGYPVHDRASITDRGDQHGDGGL